MGEVNGAGLAGFLRMIHAEMFHHLENLVEAGV